MEQEKQGNASSLHPKQKEEVASASAKGNNNAKRKSNGDAFPRLQVDTFDSRNDNEVPAAGVGGGDIPGGRALAPSSPPLDGATDDSPRRRIAAIALSQLRASKT